MASTCTSNCINNTHISLQQRRQAHVNIHRWTESDVKLASSLSLRGVQGHPRVVDCISCRQLYLRSYSFSRKRSVPEKTKKYLSKVRERVKKRSKSSSKRSKDVSRKRFINRKFYLRRVKVVSFAAFVSIFRRLLSWKTKIGMVDHEDSI